MNFQFGGIFVIKYKFLCSFYQFFLHFSSFPDHLAPLPGGAPPSGRPARKDQSRFLHRKPDLLRFHGAMKTFQFQRDHIGKNRRRQACRIGIDQEKQRVVTEDLSAQPDKRMD